MTEDETMMRLAIEASRQAALRGDSPFGAVLTKAGRILQVSGNTENTTADRTAHAEVEVLRVAQRKYGAEALRGTTVYASGEPCAMCSGTMFWAGVTRVVIGATQEDIRGHLGGPQLGTTCRQILEAAHPAVLVEGPVLRDEAAAVLVNYSRQSD